MMLFRVVLLFLFFTSTSYSKTLIVSDIDDTIKASHVRDTTDTVSNAFVTTIAFKGMKEVYEEVLREPEAEIAYVTNAPESVMKSSHTKFIKKNFPYGKIYFRVGNSKTHKYDTIKKLIEGTGASRLILVGDNGEQDIEFYHRIYQEFRSHLPIITYVRMLYAEPHKVLPLAEEQLGFVSPLEILADLTINGFVSFKRYIEVAEKLAHEIHLSRREASKDPHYFPKWLNCKGYEPVVPDNLRTPIIVSGLQKIVEICQENVQIQLNEDRDVENSYEEL